MADKLWSDDEWRAAMTTAQINDLPDSAFAHIETGGEKDESGKTTPRGLRHYPIHDKAHADNALARANAQIEGGDDDAKAIATKALPAIKAAVKKFADDKEAKATAWAIEHRDDMSYGDLSDLLEEALSIKFCGKDEYCWVVDFTDTTVVFSVSGETKQIDYAVDGDDTVTFTGQAVPVTSKTEWVPTQVNVQSNSARRAAKKPRHRAGPISGLEVRHFAAEGLELRDDGSNNLQLVGMPIVYNQGYDVRDWAGTFRETMRPGVVTDLLANGCDTRFLFNHSGLPLARTTSGTLTLEDSAKGLTCIANLDARQQLATDLAVAVERGDVTQMSVGMIVGDDEWPDNETRFVNKIKALEDVSPVTYPASPTTSISIAQRMLMDMPVESRERVRRMWAITRDLHDGRPVEPADIDVLSDGLRALAEADEVTIEVRVDDEPDTSLVGADLGALAEALTHVTHAERIAGDNPKWVSLADVRLSIVDAIAETRSAPTPQDKGIANKISVAHHAIADAINSQMKDPDNATDPVDSQVMGHLHDAAKSILKATGAQAVDGAPDGVRCASCGVENRGDANFCAGCGAPVVPAGVLAGSDSTIGVPSTASDGNATSQAYDNTGIRQRLEIEKDLNDIQRRRRNRNK